MPPFALLSAAPTDLTLLVLSFLSPATLTTCAATSTALRRLCLHDLLWQQLLLKHPSRPLPLHLCPTVPSSCYAQYLARSLDALRTFVTLPELLHLRWRFVFHHSIPFSLLTSLTPTFNDTHVHAPPFGSYPYALYDRERGSDRAEGGEEEREEGAPFLDLDGLPFIPAPPAASASAPPSPLLSPPPPAPTVYELRGFLTPQLRAECERLWAQHDESLHSPDSHAQLLAARSPLFARSPLPFTVLHLIDMMTERSVCFQHLPLFVSERVEGGRWRLNNQLGAFESLSDNDDQQGGGGEGQAEPAREGWEGQEEEGGGGGGGGGEAGEERGQAEQGLAEELFELNDWLGDLDDEEW